MLEHTKKPLTDATPQVFLGVVCEQAILEQVKASLQAHGCAIQEERPALPLLNERDWLTIEEAFPGFHAGNSLRGAVKNHDAKVPVI